VKPFGGRFDRFWRLALAVLIAAGRAFRTRFAVASFTPMICGCLAKRAMVSTLISTTLRPGILYITMGRSTASAIALKCRYRPSCVGLL
jgi:hypothetical protein